MRAGSAVAWACAMLIVADNVCADMIMRAAAGRGKMQASVRDFASRPYGDVHVKQLENSNVASNYVVASLPKNAGTMPNYQYSPEQVIVNGRMVQTYIFNLSNPRDHFSFYPPLNGCPGMIQTSVTANEMGCDVAMNGGYFDVNRGSCLGNLVSDGKVIQVGSSNVNFGFTSSQYVVGYLADSDVRSTFTFSQLISGVGWLIKEGKIFVQESLIIERPSFGFVNERAGRSAIGHDSAGNLIQVQVDGNEDLKEGVTLLEWASILENFGLYNAINLDGGSSCTVVKDGALANRISRFEGLFPVPFERHVTSITCIH